MTLRLVLVSLVAALGLSIPGTPMIENWVASTQNWVNATFADWDTRNPPTADYVIVSDSYDPTSLIESRTVATASTPALMPELTETRPVQSSTEKLSAAPDHVLAATSSDVLDTLRPVSFVRTRVSFEPLVVNEGTHRDFAMILNRGNDGIGLAVPRVISRELVRPRFQPLTVDEHAAPSVADMLNALNEGIGIQPAKLATSPRFDPIEVSDEQEVGIAYELNRQSEGIGIQPIEPAAEKKVEAKATATDVARTESTSGPGESFAELDRLPNLYFDGELAASTVAPLATSPEPEIAAPVVSTVLYEPTDLDTEIEGELSRFDDGFGRKLEARPAVDVAAIPTTMELPVRPLLRSDHFFGAFAEELGCRAQVWNRQALTVVETSVASTTPANPSLKRAVRLTTEAVAAWLNVLTGPAIVTVSHSR